MKDYVSDLDDEKPPPFAAKYQRRMYCILSNKRRRFFIIKVRYIILPNFFDNEPISKIFSVLKSWQLALSNATVFSKKGKQLSSLRHTWSWKSRFETGPAPPPPHRNGRENSRITGFVMDGWSGIEKVTNEASSYQVWGSYDHFRVYISNKNEKAGNEKSYFF